MSTSSQNLDPRAEAKARVRAKIAALKAMPPREYVYHLLCATNSHADAEQIVAAVERDAQTDLLAENARLTARVAELEAKTARRGARLVALENDALNMRSALSPNGFPRRVPMELGETLTPVVEWLLDRVAELEKSAQTRHCGRAMVHPEHRWMSARESVQCPGTEAGA